MEVLIFMFCLENKDMIMSIIDQRKEDAILIPVYVKVGNKVYSILDMEDIINCSPSIFKVGFGSSDSIFMKKRFPKKRLIEFDNPRIFGKFDEDLQCTTEYILFEASYSEGEDQIDDEINMWSSLLLDKAMKYSDEHRRKLLQSINEDFS